MAHRAESRRGGIEHSDSRRTGAGAPPIPPLKSAMSACIAPAGETIDEDGAPDASRRDGADG
ncbi:MAG: hypothetical protein B7Y61_21745, partial [Rhizobiales bacterium 35-66-30]